MAKLEVLFRPGDVAYIIERETITVYEDCRSKYHSSHGCPNCKLTGKVKREKAEGQWQPVAVRVDAVVWDRDGVFYFTDGGWQGGIQRRLAELYATFAVAQMDADGRNELDLNLASKNAQAAAAEQDEQEGR